MSLHHRRIGEGPVGVLVLHGFLGSGRNLWPLATRLAEALPELSFYCMDLPGHGVSPALPPDAELSHMVDTVAAACGALPPLSAVIGHSLGGKVAMRLPNPEFQARILLDMGPEPSVRSGTGLDEVGALLATAPPSAPSRDIMRAHFIEGGLSRALSDWLLMNLERTPSGLVWRIHRDALLGFADRFRAESHWDAVERDPERLACIRGGASPFVSDEAIARLAGMGAVVHTIPGAGHFIHVDGLQPLTTWLDGYLRDRLEDQM